MCTCVSLIPDSIESSICISLILDSILSSISSGWLEKWADWLRMGDRRVFYTDGLYLLDSTPVKLDFLGIINSGS